MYGDGEQQSPPPPSNIHSNGNNGAHSTTAQPSLSYLDELGRVPLNIAEGHHALMASALLGGGAGERREGHLFTSSSSSPSDQILSDLEAMNALEAGDLSILASDAEKTVAAVTPGEFNSSSVSAQLLHSTESYAQASAASMGIHQQLRVDIDHGQGNGHNGNGQHRNGASLFASHHYQSILEGGQTSAVSTSTHTAPMQINTGGRRSSSSSGVSRGGGGHVQAHEFASLTPLSAAQLPPTPTLPPVVISPAEVDFISVQLEKNQQCACKDCGKLFNSVWYLKQHAVKHSNDRPFKCKFCMKTYKFRSNLYQHKCPERSRHMSNGGGVASGTPFRKRFYTRGIAYIEQHRPVNSLLDEAAEKSSLPAGEVASSSKRVRAPSANGGENPLEAIYGQQREMEFASPNADSGVGYLSATSAHPPTQLTPAGNSDGLFGGGGSYPQQLQSNMSLTYGTQGTLGYAFPSSTLPGQHHLAAGNAAQSPTSIPSSFLSIRERPLTQEQIDAFLQRNRHRVYPCRKCRLHFPCREYLSRHMAWHNADDALPQVCDQCPQRFATEALLKQHFLQHSDNSPHRCMACYGTFRSALALRRHKDQCRQCTFPLFGSLTSALMISPSAPLDQFGFVGSDDEGTDSKRGPTTSATTALADGKDSVLVGDRDAKRKVAVPAMTSSTGEDSGRCSSNESSHSSAVAAASAAGKHTETSPVNQRIVSFEMEEEEDDTAATEDHPHGPHLPRSVSSKMTHAGKMLLKQELSLGDLVATDGSSDTGDSGFRSRLNSTFSAASTNPPTSGAGQSANDGGQDSGGGSPPPSCTSSAHKSSTSSNGSAGDGSDCGATSSGSSSPNHGVSHQGGSSKVGASKTTVSASGGSGGNTRNNPSGKKQPTTAKGGQGRAHNRQHHSYYSLMEGDIATHVEAICSEVGRASVDIHHQSTDRWRHPVLFNDSKPWCEHTTTKLSREFFGDLFDDDNYIVSNDQDTLCADVFDGTLRSSSNDGEYGSISTPANEIDPTRTPIELLEALFGVLLAASLCFQAGLIRRLFIHRYLAAVLDTAVKLARVKKRVDNSTTGVDDDREPRVATLVNRAGRDQHIVVSGAAPTPSQPNADAERVVHRRPLEHQGERVAADAARASSDVDENGHAAIERED